MEVHKESAAQKKPVGGLWLVAMSAIGLAPFAVALSVLPDPKAAPDWLVMACTFWAMAWLWPAAVMYGRNCQRDLKDADDHPQHLLTSPAFLRALARAVRQEVKSPQDSRPGGQPMTRGDA